MARAWAYLDVPRPFVMAHRGFSPDGLENSMAAFRAAVDLGVSHLETDVHATSDGVLVAFHDDRLDRLTDGRGRIAALPYAQVRRARIGGTEPIPSLEEVLEAFPRTRINIDVKATSAVRPLVRLLRRTRAYDRVCVASFSDLRRRLVQTRLAQPVAASPGRTLLTAYWAAGRLPGAGRPVRPWLARRVACLQVPPQAGPMRVDRAFTEAAHAAGLQVHVWTVNDPEVMRRLVADGVDAIITDRADLALQVVAR